MMVSERKAGVVVTMNIESADFSALAIDVLKILFVIESPNLK